MDAVTQQNAALVEQATAASHSMREEASGLAALVSIFTLDAPRGNVRALAAVPMPAKPRRSDTYIKAA
jgi:methyl-accepting chemotaxis protein